MKYILLFMMGIGFAFAINAQNSFSKRNDNSMVLNASSAKGEVNRIEVCTATSMKGLRREETRIVSYNPELDVISVTAVLEPGVYDGIYDDGVIGQFYSTDKGISWEGPVVLADDLSQGVNYYYSGAVYNPVGNTNVTAAYGVCHGAIYPSGDWNVKSFGSSSLAGTNQENLLIEEPDEDLNHNGYWNIFGLTQVNDEMRCLNMVPTGQWAEFSDIALEVQVGEFDGNGFQWDFHEIIEVDLMLDDEGVVLWQGRWSGADAGVEIAWSADGMIAYMWVLGVSNSNISGYQPILFKTEDGANSWEAIIVDFQTDVAQAMIEDFIEENWVGQRIPCFFESAGMVNLNGDLEIIACVNAQKADIWSYPDSISYGYEGPGELANFTINTNGLSEVNWIESLATENVRFDTEGNYANASGWNHRIQVSKNENGSQLFCTWTDTKDGESEENIHPDLFGWTKSISETGTLEMFGPISFTEGTGFESHYYYTNSALLAYVDGENYVVPTVQGVTPDEFENNSSSADDPITINYIQGIEFPALIGVNYKPIVVNPIPDMILDEGFVSYDIDFSDVFEDPDEDDVLSYTVESNNTSVVGVSISGNTLTLTENGIGIAIITLTADDGNAGITADVFIVNVNTIGNNPPIIVNPIPDMDIDEGFGTYGISIENVFDDPDGDDLSFTTWSDNESVVMVSISGNTLFFTEVEIGEATITIMANDGLGGAVSDSFVFEINWVNIPPVVINPILDVELDEGFGSYSFDFSDVFEDADGDDLSFNVESSDNQIVTVVISGSHVILTEQGIGNSSITLSADDGNGGAIEDEFSVLIIEEICVAPINLEAYVDYGSYSMFLDWDMEGIAEDEFRYDDGVATGQLGAGSGDIYTVMGNLHTVDAELTEMSWYLTEEGGPHNSIVIYVMGLDVNGIPDGNNVLFSEEVSNTDEQWNTYAFTAPIIANTGFFIGVAYDGFVALGTDDGVGDPYVFQDNTHFFNMDYTADDWESWESWNFEINGMIRAEGVAGAINSYSYAGMTALRNNDLEYFPLENPVVTDVGEARQLIGFNVYRDGYLISPSLVIGTYYVDPDLMPDGEYCYHITAVYSECGESGFSNEACDGFWEAIPELNVNDINIHPNPSTGLIHISIDNYSKLVDLSVYNLLGELIAEKSDVDNESLSLDLSNNESGVYFVKIATDNDAFVKRIVIK